MPELVMSISLLITFEKSYIRSYELTEQKVNHRLKVVKVKFRFRAKTSQQTETVC